MEQRISTKPNDNKNTGTDQNGYTGFQNEYAKLQEI
jgi:hypothetical protein